MGVELKDERPEKLLGSVERPRTSRPRAGLRICGLPPAFRMVALYPSPRNLVSVGAPAPPGGRIHHVYFDRSGLPDLEPFIRFEPPATGRVYDVRGKVLIELGGEYRKVVSYDEVPVILCCCSFLPHGTWVPHFLRFRTIVLLRIWIY